MSKLSRGHILSRIKSFNMLSPNLSMHDKVRRLVSAVAHMFNDSDPDRAQFTLAYLIIEAALNGELVPAQEDGDHDN